MLRSALGRPPHQLAARRRGCEQLTTFVAQPPLHERDGAALLDHRALADDAARASRRKKVRGHVDVGTTKPGPPMVASAANDITRSSMAASMPPCMVRSRLQNTGFASNQMMMRPAYGSHEIGMAPT